MIYLDNAATTKAFAECSDVMKEWNEQFYFNPSALYKQSVDVARAIKTSREYLVKTLGAPDGDLVFLSGGSEADNTAMFCTRKQRGSRIIVGGGEHDAINNCAIELKQQGFDVVFAPVNAQGAVDVEEFKKLVTPETSLVSVMHVSNETGAINDIRTLCATVKKIAPKAVFHSDGVQAFEKIGVNIRNLGIDMYSISGHKIHAPKGIGALWIKKGVSIRPLIYGGGQEKGLRSGTENVPLIMAFAKAVELNEKDFDANYSKKRLFLELLKDKILDKLPETKVVSPEEGGAPHVLTLAFKNVRGEVLLHTLENYGILCGIGSACSSHHESRFKDLLQLDKSHRDGIIRFSVSEFNTPDQIDTVVDALKIEVPHLAEFTRI